MKRAADATLSETKRLAPVEPPLSEILAGNLCNQFVDHALHFRVILVSSIGGLEGFLTDESAAGDFSLGFRFQHQGIFITV
jgi:hypothetical protein